jgi:hypothetical protein
VRAEGLFRTTNLNFAAYLVASARLKFVQVEARPRYSDFYFDDPRGEGPSIESEYRLRDLKVGARTLFDCRSRLVSEVMRSGGSR